jgi:glutamate-5-semialdehyde dehydrogenase
MADLVTEELGSLGPLAGPARRAARALAGFSRTAKDTALLAWADGLLARTPEVLEANAGDLEAATASGETGAVIDRLCLDEERIRQMGDGLRQIASLPDPVGTLLDHWTLPNGLRVEKVRVPLGVIAVIYEGRPNVTADAAGLAVKAGSAVLLRGSRIAERSNAALVRVLRESGEAAGLPPGTVQAVPPTRAAAAEMMRARGLIDLLIPRGGNDLIQAVVAESKVPVIETGVGNCHVYVDARADLEKALRILVNAKVQRPGVCNAAESLLVHRDAAPAFLPRIGAALAARDVELRGCPETRRLIPAAKPATDEDYDAEYLDLILSVKVVADLDEAVGHIARHGSGHTEAIVTGDLSAARRFVAAVDSAAVMVNASTRFHDGFEFGLGAEIGISTDKVHARGPCGLQELTSYKWVVYGDGQVRE